MESLLRAPSSNLYHCIMRSPSFDCLLRTRLLFQDSEREEPSPPKQCLPLQTRTGHRPPDGPHADVQSRRAPASINTCHDVRFAPHVGADGDARWISNPHHRGCARSQDRDDPRAHPDGLRGKPDFLSEAHGPSTVALQQRCHRASAPARRPSWPSMPLPRPQRPPPGEG